MTFSNTVSREEIRQILRLSVPSSAVRQKIVMGFMKGRSEEELAALMRESYRGGYGLRSEQGSAAAWFAEDGLRLAHGNAARHIQNAQILSWQGVAKQVGELLEQGQFATQEELIQAPVSELHDTAGALWETYRSISEEARQRGLLWGLREYRGMRYREVVEALSQALEEPERRAAIVAEYRIFLGAWKQNPAILPFGDYLHSAELLPRMEELGMPLRQYHSGLTRIPQAPSFITEDEINDVLTNRAFPWKSKVYEFWQQEHTKREKAAYLKREYSSGAYSGAFSRHFDNWIGYDAKGVKLEKPLCEEVFLPWSKAVGRIDALMRQKRYLTADEQTQYQTLLESRDRQAEEERQRQLRLFFQDYQTVKKGHPDDLVVYQRGAAFEVYSKDAQNASLLLDIPLSSKPAPGNRQIDCCTFPADKLDEYTDKLRVHYGEKWEYFANFLF